MKVYKTQDIRNVAVLGHGGCGKTTLVEAMAFTAGLTSRQGKVVDGNTLSDFDKEEIKRKFSIKTSIIPIEWNYWKINIMDTPGYFDFCGEVEEALAVADAAIIVVNAKAGVEAGTERAWKFCEKYSVPRAIFVTNMDDEHADYKKVIEDLRERYGKKVAPFHFPIKEGNAITGAVNVVKMEGRKFLANGKWEKRDIPADLTADLEETREFLMESIAETSEELMEKYFGGEEFTEDEIIDGLRNSINEGSIVPVELGSGLNCLGIENVLSTCVEFMPSPIRDNVKMIGKDPRTDKEHNVDYDSRRPFSAYVWKTIV
ncbi:MAG: GTP-binding protein, partial [Lachnospiraceae bacterium]|nr:GTP-binding protein [Lachnospiraceae bacterium]